MNAQIIRMPLQGSHLQTAMKIHVNCGEGDVSMISSNSWNSEMRRTSISFKNFFEKIKPLMKGKKCPVKREIAKQIFSLNKDKKWSEKVVEQAFKLALLNPFEKDAAELLRSFQRGTGSKEYAATLYYFLHSLPLYNEHAKSIDYVAFEEETFEQRFGLQVFSFEYDKTESEPSATSDATIQAEIDKLRSRLEEACLAAQEYPSLILLLDEITNIFELNDVHYDGQEGFFYRSFPYGSNSVV